MHVTTHSLFTPCCLVRARARFPYLSSQTTPHRSELLATMISNEPPSSRANHTHSLNHAIGRCPSSSVARGRPAVTCRDRRQSDTAVSQLIRPELVHLLPPHCGIIINDTATTAFTLHLHTVHVIAKASIANSHSSRDESIHRLALSPSLPTSPPLSLSSRFHHKKC